jgi:hypothetical protein
VSSSTLSLKPIRLLRASLRASLGLNLEALLGDCLGFYLRTLLGTALVAISLLGPIALRALRAYIGSIGLNRTTLYPVKVFY